MEQEIVGRDEELAAIERWLDDPRPSALLIEGDAGIGKTTLWRAGIEAARGRSRVLAARPTQAESTLSFAALGDLLEGVLGEVLEPLPAPQRQALRAALLLEGTEDGPAAPDPRAVALAFLGSVRELVSAGPVLVAVDDVQWLDPPSATTLAFAARRLETEEVGLLLARRAGHVDAVSGQLERIEEIALGGLSAGALHRLLRERLELVLARPALRRLHELSGGNPFYALELGRAYQAGEIGLGRSEPLPPSLDSLVGSRIASLSEETQEALAAAAALSHPTAAMVAPPEVLAPALAADVIVLEEGEVRFTHPLLASAAYGALDPERRRALHARLATLSEDEEERARHFALSRDAPDEEVASALESAAYRARLRGAGAVAAELCESAYTFTPLESSEARGRRGQLAGRYRLVAGDTVGARTMLDRALEEPCSPSLLAETLTALGHVHMSEGDVHAAVASFRSALDLASTDASVRAAAARGLALGLFRSRDSLEEALASAKLAVKLAEDAGDAKLRAGSLAVVGLVEGLLGRPGARATIASASPGIWDPYGFAGQPPYLGAALDLWTDRADDAIRTLAELVRADVFGGIHVESLALIALGYCMLGRLSEAAAAADRAIEAALETGQRTSLALGLAVRGLMQSFQGRETEARSDATEAEGFAVELGQHGPLTVSTWALGLLELSLGRAANTVQTLAPLRSRLVEAGVGEPGWLPFFADEVEALVMLGRREEAEGLLDWFEERAHALDRASALAKAARCRGLLAAARGDGAGALVELERAVEEHARVTMPFERARTLLALGSARRRAKQKAAARRTLDEALAIFTELGAALWGEKAAAELARIGGRVATRDELTATERRVAELVAEGKTNREVAAAMFVTAKTVEFHLRHVYRKLGVRTRTELARKLATASAHSSKT